LSKYKKDLLHEIDGLPTDKLKAVLDFVCFIKMKEAIDPTQAYFWSQKWQDLERGVNKDKIAGRLIGDGSVKGLLSELKS
jgi:hypothetical protein